MYKSPITVNMMDELTQRFIEQTEDGIVAKVREVMHIDIDKDELAKALKYDRYQYEHGYANGRMDGHASGYKERDDEIVRCGECKHGTIMKNYLGDEMVQCGCEKNPIGRWNDYERWLMPKGFYCADGERKRGDEDK